MAQAFRLYGKLSARLLIYFFVFVVSTAAAMFLDLRIGLRPSSVLVYTTVLIALLLITVPAASVLLEKLTVRVPFAVARLDKVVSGLAGSIVQVQGDMYEVRIEDIRKAVTQSALSRDEASREAIESINKLEEFIVNTEMSEGLRKTLAHVLIGLMTAEFRATEVWRERSDATAHTPNSFIEGYDKGVAASARAVYEELLQLLTESSSDEGAPKEGTVSTVTPIRKSFYQRFRT
jgi:predicted RecB family endonuclease